jgi:hypothetical protein
VNLVDGDVKDATVSIKDATNPLNNGVGILNHEGGVEGKENRIDKPDSLRVPTHAEKPIKSATPIKDARIPTVEEDGNLNHAEAEAIKSANGGSLRACIHELDPKECKVCNGYVRRLIENRGEGGR